MNLAQAATEGAAVLIVLGGLGGTGALLVHYTPPSLRMPLAASAVWHVALIAAIAHIGYAALHVDDPVQYDRISALFAHQARLGMAPNFSAWEITSFGYYAWVAAFYVVFGSHPLVGQLVNVLLALAAGVLTYHLARRIGGSERAAWLAGTAALLYPTLAIWSAMLLKDILAVVGLLLCLHLLITMIERRAAPWSWIALAACAFGLTTIRFYDGMFALGMGAVVGLGGCLLALVRREPRGSARLRAAAAALSGLALMLATMWGAFHVGEGLWYRQLLTQPWYLKHTVAHLAGGKSSLAPEDVDSVDSAAVLNPEQGVAVKFLRFFVVPLPSQHGSQLMRLAKVDWLFWWPLVPLAAWGARRGLAASWLGTVIISVSILGFALGYGLAINNAGSLVRYRADLFPLAAALGSLSVGGWVAVSAANTRGPESWKRFA